MNKTQFKYIDISTFLLSTLLIMSIMLTISDLKASPILGPQSSTINESWNVDFLEQFDGLQDWLSQGTEFPLLADGSASAWNFTVSSSYALLNETWISTFQDQRVWRGTKSATIDLSGEKGPSQLGLSLGNGYENFYLFFMLNMAKNQFPTDCIGGNCQDGALGRYIEGEPYTWFPSWPLLSIKRGCTKQVCVTSEQGMQQNFHLKQYRYGLTPGIMLSLDDSYGATDLWALDDGNNLDAYLGDWFALEIHVSQTDIETIFTIWVYDKAGKALKVLDHKALSTSVELEGRAWNRIVFGGQHHGSFTWGPTMQAEYYIDDVIIDDKRIGIKYFNLVNEINLAPSTQTVAKARPAAPSAPFGFKVRVVKSKELD